MGVSCCKNENERNDDIDSCENISDIRDCFYQNRECPNRDRRNKLVFTR